MTPEQKKEYMKKWREANKAHISAYNKKYFKENPQYLEKYREKNREHINTQKINYQRKYKKEYLKENGPCAKCGSWKRLEVDHIDPNTKTSNVYWHWSKKRREAELLKCQVLCFFCHRLKTSEERGWEKHGSVMYRKGCRCKKCVIGYKDHLKRMNKKEPTEYFRDDFGGFVW